MEIQDYINEYYRLFDKFGIEGEKTFFAKQGNETFEKVKTLIKEGKTEEEILAILSS